MSEASARRSSVSEGAQHKVPGEGADRDKVNPLPTGPNGLVLLWREDSGDTANVLSDFDIVAIHGLHGERDMPWRNPGSGDSSWMCYRHGEGKRVLSFGYDVRRILAGRRTREVIRQQALKLLDDLMAVRESDVKRRPIAFLAHDVGGIIAKDALAAAGIYAKTYGDIFDYTRFLIFYGCPHRSNDILDMENRIARFLFGRFMNSRVGDTVTKKSTESLAAAVMQINGLFLQSKIILRTHVVSMFAGVDEEGIDIDPVFDMYCGTIGAPFERQIKCRGDDQAEIFQNRQKMQSLFAPDSRTLNHERTLLNLASPIFTFLTAYDPDHSFSWITSNKIYQAWLDYPDPQLLYVYGKAGAQEASEYMFYSLDDIRQASEKNEVVVYFTFDPYDLRYLSAKNMLGTFLAQIINHHPTLAEFVLLQFNSLRLDRSLNMFDLLSWFEYFRCRGQIDGVTCVINHFDDCDDASRRAFLQRFSYISSVHERPWKIVVTSRQPGVLLEELSDWPALDLDSAMANLAASTHPDSSCLIKLPQRLSIDEGLIEKQVAELEIFDPLVRRVILQQACVRDDWSAYASPQSPFGSAEDPSLMSILEQILQGVSNPELAKSILIWVLYSVLPLTIWELGTAIFIRSPKDSGIEHTASADFIEGIVGKIRTWFAGILRIVDNEIIVEDVQIRQALMELIGDEDASGHKTIAETCIDYLQRDSVEAIIEATYIRPYVQAETDPLSMDAPTFTDRTSLYSYAIENWTCHFVLIPPRLRPLALLHRFVESKTVYCWSKGNWVLGQPISRSARYQFLYPLYTALGLGDDAEPWRNGDEDLSLALAEAALHGFGDAVKSLLSRATHPVPALQETLITAGSYGNKETLMYVIRHIKENYSDFDWPPSLLYRAAWLGFDEVVSALLDLGVPVHPDDSAQRSTPLHNAARNGHVKVLKVLLKSGADVMCRGPYGQTALHIACANGHPDSTRVLAEAGADLDARDDNNFTPLYEASLWGNFKSVEVLVTLGSDTTLGTSIKQDSPGWTPLIVSSEEGYTRCLKALLDAKADPNLAGTHGTPLHYAVTKGHVDICQLLLNYGADPNHPKLDPPILTQIFTNVKDTDLRFQLLKLLIEKGASVDATDSSRMSALLHAALLGDTPSIEYLLDHGANIGLADIEGRTAFHAAVDQDHVEVVRLLLDKGRDRHSAEHHEQAPLFSAIKNPEMARLLLERGANPDVRSRDGVTPLMQAAGADHAEIVKVLLEYDATVDLDLWNTNDGANSGWTALAFAAERGNSDGVRLLAEAGADVNHRMGDGSTALHLAIGGGAMRMLMEFRPDLDITDNEDNTPLHCICSWTVLEHIQLLVRAGASLDAQNKEGCTPLGIALRNSNETVASYLIERRTNVNLASQTYGAPVHLACRNSTVAMVRRLVEAGADVDLAVQGAPGTPLQAAVLRRGFFDEEANEIIRYLINEAGADVNRTGGTYGTVLAVAALQGSSTIVSFLLEKGADSGLADGMGRFPLHMAMLHELDNVKLIHSAGADLRARDGTGRSVLHWAAQGGSADVMHYLLELLSDNEDFDIDDKDNEGWTALCWAARGCVTEFRTTVTEAQIEVIKLLLKRGAGLGVQARFSNKEWWTPLKIAQYSGAPDEVLELLNPVTAKKAGDDGHEEAKQKPVASVQRAVTKAFLHIDSYCTFCLGEIRGIRYQCKDCIDFGFCYKCYNSRRRLHTEGHLFDEIGPEFASIYGTSETSSSGDRDSNSESDGASEIEDK